MRGHSFVLAAIAVALTAVSCLAWIQLPIGGPTLTTAADNACSTLVPMAAALACVWAARRYTGRSRAGWILLGASALSWGLGSAIWSYYNFVLKQTVPFPSPADATATATFGGSCRPRPRLGSNSG